MAYHPKITAQFGADLFKLLGPKANRVKWNTLPAADKERRISKIPVYVNTRTLGKSPALVDIVIHCFNELVNLGMDNPLLGIDLPELDNLFQAAESMGVPAMNYGSNLEDITGLHKNASKQRDVFLRHIFVDIIFRFNPGLVFPGIGRKNSKGQIMVNDAQHRTLACIMLGIGHVPISYIFSDEEYWDIAQYAAINIHSLSASEFDRYRIKFNREQAARDAGYPSEPEDAICYELHELFEDLGIIVTERGDKQGNAMVLTGVGNMIKYRQEYDKDHFRRATELNARMFPTSIFHTANSWGIMEFLKTQKKDIDPHQMDYAIMNALKKRWKNNNSGGQMHSSIKDAYKTQIGVSATQSRIPEPVIIAEGIYQICKAYEPSIDWQPPNWPSDANKFNLPIVRQPMNVTAPIGTVLPPVVEEEQGE